MGGAEKTEGIVINQTEDEDRDILEWEKPSPGWWGEYTEWGRNHYWLEGEGGRWKEPLPV